MILVMFEIFNPEPIFKAKYMKFATAALMGGLFDRNFMLGKIEKFEILANFNVFKTGLVLIKMMWMQWLCLNALDL